MDKNYKNTIEEKIIEQINKSLVEKVITEDQVSEISMFVLKKIDHIATHDQLIGLLSQLAIKWPIFQPIAAQEEGKLKQMVESKVAKNVLKLINQGQASEAIDLAQSISKK